MISFSCTATIVDILPQYGWYYIACTRCKCKLGRSDTTLVCQRCNHENTVGLIKFRVELTVCDKDNVATFVIFGDDVAKLAGRKAEDILEEDVQGDDNGAIKNHTTPECLLDIVSRTYKFNIQLKAFDFTSTRQTITVTSIIKEIVDDEDSVQEEADDALCEDGSKTCEDDDDVAINQKKEKSPP
uniref:Replication factor A C-terminal domain-containing protein n=1 Tax=Noccaea caerulescens TaxID=107243 RepID=A0A1J3EJI3_NOCCA